MYYFDPTYILVIIGALIYIFAEGRVNITYSKNKKVYGIRIEHISGNLTDHYDPRDKVLRLSDTVYGSPSIAAIGVAAHECGHAIQDQEEYFPLKFRNTLVPVANIGTKAAIPIILLGMVLSASQTLINIGVMLFSLGVLFQLVTLPVEFNASNRAIRILEGTGMLQGQEVKGAKKVLGAAAMTYVAAAAASILSLLRLMLLFGGRRRND